MKLSRASLGLAVRSARKAAKLSADALAHATGIDRSALNRIENGKRSLEFQEALAISKVVGIDIENLRILAETFERAGAAVKHTKLRAMENDLNLLQRTAIEAAIELSQS